LMISALAIAGVIAVIAVRQAASVPAPRLGAYVGGDLHSLVVDPRDSNHIFVGGHDGAVESLDGGVSFRAVAGLSSIDAMGWSVSGDGRTMIVGGHSGLRVSLDGGATWHDQTSRLPASDVHGLGMDPVSPSHWWAFVSGRGVYQTIDEGKSWSLLGGTSLMIMGPIISVAGGDLLSSDMPRGVIRSKDGGRTWSTAASHVAMWLTTDPARANRIWSAAGGIAVSADGGVTWRAMPASPHGAAALAVSADNKIYAGVLTGNQATVYLSTDDGATWRRVGP
jgi:photosystem II stability/assembly factor-like uncharacterized protein